MAVYFHQTLQFEKTRARIEDYLYESVLKLENDTYLALRSVDRFTQAIEHCMETLEQMYQAPSPQDTIGEKSCSIRGGRYRIFFKILVSINNDFDVVFLDIDDNKQSNIDRFPAHRLKTFYNDD